VPIVSMRLIGPFIWITTDGAEIRYLNPSDPKVSRSLKAHQNGPVLDVVKAGRYVWSIEQNYRICLWDPVKMKPFKTLLTKHVMTSILNVDGIVWIGTKLGIVFYDSKELKEIKILNATVSGRVQDVVVSTALSTSLSASTSASLLPGAGTAERTMSVSSLLRVGPCVWAVHGDKYKISVWDATSRTVLSVFDVNQVKTIFLAGDYVWAFCCDRMIRIIDIHSHEVVKEFPTDQEGNITSSLMVKTSDGFKVWTGCEDHSVHIWNTKLKPHIFKNDGPLAGTCEVCKKTLRSFATKTKVCTICGFAVHIKCYDQIPDGCVCKGRIIV